MEKPKIALFCGGRFAYPAIQLLLLEKFLCGVVIGGGDKETVQQLSEGIKQINLPFLTIDKPTGINEIAEWLEQVKPGAVFSICFPYRLPAKILDCLPPKRFINFHTGPLPAYRGPMPIFEVLRAGEQSTAIAVHFMNEKFDEGDLIFSEEVPILSDMTFGGLAVELSERCSLAAHNMAQMLEFASSVPSQPQNKNESRYYPKPEKSDTLIRWSFMGAEEICRLINACNPWNTGADTVIGNRAIKIISASWADERHGKNPGTIINRDETGIRIACIDEQLLNVRILSDDSGILDPERFPAYLSPNQSFAG